MAIENRGPGLLAVDILFLTLAAIAVLLRTIVRTTMVKSFGRDDWLMITAMISFSLYAACSMTGIAYGTGHHSWDLEPENVATAKKFWWFCYLFYSTTMIFSKLSIGWFLLRITVKRIHNWIVYAAMTFTVITGLVFFFVTLFQCNPVNFFWTQSIPGVEGTCINPIVIVSLAYLYSGINVIVDFAFALLPGVLIYSLQLDKRTKIFLVPLLGMGCVASSAVVVRLGYLMKIIDPDFLWATVDVAIWSTVEQGLAITAGSLATIRPLMKLISYQLGWSKPSTARPSDYLAGNSAHVTSIGKGSDSTHFDSFQLSSVNRDRDLESGLKGGQYSPASVGFGSHTEYKANFAPKKGLRSPTLTKSMKSPTGSSSRTRTDSQEELRYESSQEEGRVGAGVVVTKTWIVTEGQIHRDAAKDT